MSIVERKKEALAYRLSQELDSEKKRSFLIKVAVAGMALNALSWAAAFLTPELIAGWVGFATDFVDRIQTYLLAVPFWSVFISTFALCRMRRFPSPTTTISDGDFFSGYRDSERQNSTRNLVLISGATGAINVILLMAAIIWFR